MNFSSKKGKVLLVSILVFSFLLLSQLFRLKDNSVAFKKTEPNITSNSDDTNKPLKASSFPTNSEKVLSYETSHDKPDRVKAKVIGVRDGDTIEVEFETGEKRTIRYIGIDTPESVDPRRPVECYGREASNMNNNLVMNREVMLEKDVSETDKYGRLLRYVFIESLFVNSYLVEEGFAHSSSYPPDIKYQEDLDAAEVEARNANKGLWSSCLDSSRSGLTNKNLVVDKDCSDFATHKEAQDYFVSKGGSSTNNVDKLDGSDHDGNVCETLP